MIPENASTSDQTDFETFNKEIISLDDEEFSLNNLMNFQQTFVPSNTGMDSEIFMYTEDVAKQNNDNQSLDVFMYDFGKTSSQYDRVLAKCLLYWSSYKP